MGHAEGARLTKGDLQKMSKKKWNNY